MTLYTIIAYSKNDGSELGYWQGANSTNPDGSINKTNPLDWGTMVEAQSEIKEAEKFAEKQDWQVFFTTANYN